MDMNMQKYMAFVKVVECGSFSKAAAVLSYSQSGISRMIADLEQECGLTLLERGRSGVRPTSDGIRLLPRMQTLCRAFSDLQAEAEALSGLQTGLIRIGTFSSVATHWLPNIIRAFQRDYPQIDYELLLGDYSEIEAWILEGRVDCGFLRLPAQPPLETMFLEQDRLMAVLPEHHPYADAPVFPARALCDAPFLLLGRGDKRNSDVAAFLAQNGLSPDIRFTTWDDYAIMSMVEGGLGIAILPELILRRIPYRVCVKPLDLPAYRRIGLALRDKKTASLAVRRFLDYLPERNQKMTCTSSI